LRPLSYSKKLSVKWKVLILLVGVLISSTIAYNDYSGSSLLSSLNNQFYDAYQKSSASHKVSSKIVVVDIDDISLKAVGQWPWPRYRVAALIQAIAQLNPEVIGLDIIFAEPDRTALMNVRQLFKDDFGLDINLENVPPALTDNDGYLGAVLSETASVGALFFYFDHTSSVEVSASPAFEIGGQIELLSLHDAPGILENTFKISSQLKYSGFLNNQPDDDGMLRRLPLLIKHKGIIYPHLSLATFMRSLGENSASIEEGEYGPVIRVGTYEIPITENGFTLLRFNGLPHLYQSVSAMEL